MAAVAWLYWLCDDSRRVARQVGAQAVTHEMRHLAGAGSRPALPALPAPDQSARAQAAPNGRSAVVCVRLGGAVW